MAPLLFVVYINDLPNSCKVVKTFLFAHNTSLLYSHKDRNQTIAVMNYELMKIMDRLKANKLSLNIAKTNYILFHPKQKLIIFNNNITLDNVSVKQVFFFFFFFFDLNFTVFISLRAVNLKVKMLQSERFSVL